MYDDTLELERLRQWASKVTQFMAEDKSNDWSEEIAEYEEITNTPQQRV